MNCKKCGAPLTAGDQFCKNCGQSVNGPVQNNVNNSNGGGNKLTIVLVIVIVVLVGVVGYFLFTKDKAPSNNNGNGGNTNEPATPAANKVQTYKFNYNGYTFEVPNEYLYVTADDCFVITDEAQSFAFTVEILDKSYSLVKQYRSNLKSGMTAKYTLKNDGFKTYDNKEYMTFELTGKSDSVNYIMAITKLDEIKSIGLTIVDEENEFDYKNLEIAHNIVKTVKYTGASNSIKPETPKVGSFLGSITE